jgi:dTDP-4-amino-4,6-dideoxygalactose transaminase
VSSATCLATNGLAPIFADIDPKTYNLSPSAIERKISPKTRVLVPVDFAGQAIDIDAIHEIAKRNNLYIIEDAAHAIGSFYADGKPVGCCHKADMTVFSFHPVKTITSGEGGAITTNNEALYRKLLTLRTVGITKNPAELSQNPGPWYYEMQSLGGNYRITDMQAALGRSQLSKLPQFRNRRREIVQRYNAAFAELPHITTPHETVPGSSCFHLYVLLVDFDAIHKARAQVMAELREKGVGTQVHYIPVNSQPWFVEHCSAYRPADYPVAEHYYQSALSLPLFPKMTDEEVETVISAVKETIQ